MAPSPEIYRQAGEEPGKWWRYIGYGALGVILFAAVTSAVNFRISQIEVPQI